MSAYLKLDYSTPSVNDSLKVAIVYIGKHYGKNANKKGLSEKQYLNSGIKYIAKKYDGFVNISEEDGCFSLKIMIPLTGKPKNY